MSEDSLSLVLYGRTEKVMLADNKEYVLREPCIDTLEALEFDPAKTDDIKTIKKLAWVLLRDDNTSLTEKSFGKLITLSMMKDGSDFMNAIGKVLGREPETKK